VFNVVVFIFKCWTLVFVMMWVRWTLPRLRIDQVMMTCLKYLLPISCVLLVGVSLWNMLLPTEVLALFPIVLFALCVLLVVLLIKQLITWASAPPGTGMPGMWSMVGVTGYQGARKTHS
jgi:NADH-quinone oxidoreductase subunit H